jgi:nitrite reductase/ring-hydroxylating ferredoxin subunit
MSMSMKLVSQVQETPLCRREFLQQCATGAVVLGLGMGLPGKLGARPVRWLHGTGITGSKDQVAYSVPGEDGVSVDRGNELILVRDAGAVFAFALSCPHQRSMLKWREKDQQFRCTKHGSKYDPSGEYASGRATRGMDRYAVRVEAGQVLVDKSRIYLQDEDPAGWEAAMARVG